jgi:hypothetical protein
MSNPYTTPYLVAINNMSLLLENEKHWGLTLNEGSYIFIICLFFPLLPSNRKNYPELD